MRKIFLCIAAMMFAAILNGQQVLHVKVQDSISKKPLPFASVYEANVNRSGLADSTGLAEVVFSPGPRILIVSHIGYETRIMHLKIPMPDSVLIVELTPFDEEEEEIVIQSTRSTRTIRDIPTRIEFVAGEELDEKANMKPGDIRMVLNESTGITTQQTSATSANSSIRIQGLDGRYTQILKDGFPLYGGFSGGLGLLQTPPLDLMQFEVIKGSSSTLYGGGAIAGLVNLISKTPGFEKELKFHIDVTSAGGINTSGFYGKRNKKAGVTLFASRNSNSAYDPSDVGLTAIPEFERYTVNPKFFFYIKEKTDLLIGFNVTNENRKGGDIEFIKKNKANGYSENNNTDRFSTQISLERRLEKNRTFKIKNSISLFRRIISERSTYAFAAKQVSSFSELTYSDHGERSE